MLNAPEEVREGSSLQEQEGETNSRRSIERYVVFGFETAVVFDKISHNIIPRKQRKFIVINLILNAKKKFFRIRCR